MSRFRDWDRRAAGRVDRFIANSRYIAAAIDRCYGRDAEVIYPPVAVERFVAAGERRAATARGGDYVTVSRLAPYKRVDVLVEAFRALPERRLVVIGDGPERARLKALRVPNVEFAGWQDDVEIATRVADARAFLFAAEEDFGIAPVEAQAAGTPVIAFGRGGVRESVRAFPDPAPTGVFFDEQSPQAVIAAIRTFEAQADGIAPAACRDNALRFAPARFRAEIARAVDAACTAHATHRAITAAA
jgi:glycosyltransferase involved in cell wall biosynthesis